MSSFSMLAKALIACLMSSGAYADEDRMYGPSYAVSLLAQPASPETPPAPDPALPKTLAEAVFQSLKEKPESKQKKIEKKIAVAEKDLANFEKKTPALTTNQVTMILRDTLSHIAKAGGPTAFLAVREDQDFAAWQSAFSGSLEGARTAQIGAQLSRLGGKWFVSKVYSGSPAEQAGIMDGDEWVRTGGQNVSSPVSDVERTKPQASLTIPIRRRPGEPTRDVVVSPRFESVQETLLRHMEKTHRTLVIDSHPVAYVALPAASHPVFRQTLIQLAQHYQGHSEAMILDLRDGIIGPDATYIEAFLGDKASYTKPLIVLIDRSTGGGRERLAAFLQKTRRAVLVGERTMGLREALALEDIVPGEASLLYPQPSHGPSHGPSQKPEATSENRPVIPDYAAERIVLYSAGGDAQLAQGLKVVLGEIKKPH